MKNLSIVITNYNKGDRIITLLEQLKIQLIPTLDLDRNSSVQVIIVDDCSTDGSVDKIRDFISDLDFNAFTLYINSSNLGPGLSRNRGLDLCEGKWITFIDGDDEIVSSYIGTILSWISNSDADLICFDYETVNCISDVKVEHGLNTMLWTKLFRGNIIYDNHIRVDEERYKGLVFGEDLELLYLFMSKTDKYIKNPAKLIRYNWGIGICNYPPERYESSVPDGWEDKYRWLFTFNQSGTILDFWITSHCNRNCSNCIAMIPYYKERKHESLEDIKHRLSFLLPELQVISILGGETFLHPDLKEIIKEVKNSGVLSIYVYTNGSVEPDNLQEVLDEMDSRFTISISKYPRAKILDFSKYKLPYGVNVRVTECDWFLCGAPVENDLPKICKGCVPKTFINKDDKVYMCHRFSMLDKLGICKLQDNEWCYLEDFKAFKDTFNYDFSESCKYCLVGTEECVDIPSGS